MMMYSKVLKWIGNFRMERGMLKNDHHSLAQLGNLFPGVYYRLELEPEFHITILGEGIFDVLGYKAKELLNKNTFTYLRLVHPEHEKILIEKKNLCKNSREVKTLQYHLFTRSRSVKLVEDRFIGEYDQAGNLVAINGYLKAAKKSTVKQELLNQLEAYRAAIDVNIISSITDPNGIIIYTNGNFQKISQYTDEELLGGDHRIISSGYHTKSFFEKMWKTISTGELWHGEILNRAKDGSLFWVASVIIPVFGSDNKITSYLSLCLLITDQKRAEEQREKYIHVLENIANVVSHDVRGPICSILGLMNIVEKTNCREDDLKPMMDYMVSEVNKLDQITRNLSAKIHTIDMEIQAKKPVVMKNFEQNGKKIELTSNGQIKL